MQAQTTSWRAKFHDVFNGAEGDMWELLTGQQLNIGGMETTLDLAKRAGVGQGMRGINLFCLNGAAMRVLVRYAGVERMLGVDSVKRMIERGRRRTEEEGLASRIEFVLADVCSTGLPTGEADFVWSEGAWCYLSDKRQLVAEACRLIKPKGIIAFTDWIQGSGEISEEETDRYLAFMKFPSMATKEGYEDLLREHGCDVLAAEDSGRFPAAAELFLCMIEKQLTYDALKILDYDEKRMKYWRDELAFTRDLARTGKVAQGLFAARKR